MYYVVQEIQLYVILIIAVPFVIIIGQIEGLK